MDGTLLCRTTTSELYVGGNASIVKRSGVLAPPGNVLGRREVDFYALVREFRLALPVPFCFEARYDGDCGRLLLEDLRSRRHAPAARGDQLARPAHRTLIHGDMYSATSCTERATAVRRRLHQRKSL